MLLAWFLNVITGTRLLAFALAVSWGFSSAFWGQTGVAEVYVFFLAIWFAAVVCVWEWSFKRSRRLLLAGSFLTGLAGTVHPLGVFLVPVFLFLVYMSRPKHADLVALAGIPCGWLLLLYIPLRATTDPVINWGNPQTITSLIEYFAQVDFRAVMAPNRAPWDPLPVEVWVRSIVESHGWPLLGLAPLGMFNVRYRVLAFAMLGTVVLNQAVLQLYDSPEIVSLSLPSSLAVWVLAGIGIGTETVRMFRARSQYANMIIAVALLVWSGWGAYSSFPRLNLGDSEASHIMANSLAILLPRDALFVTSSSTHLFLVWYLQVVEHRRTDVKTVFSMLTGRPWYIEQLRQKGVLLPPLRDSDWLKKLQALNPGPVVVSSFWPGNAGSLAPLGPLFLYVRKSGDREWAAARHDKALSDLMTARGDDLASVEHRAKIQFQLGLYHIEARNRKNAINAFQECLQLRPTDYGAMVNLATLLRDNGSIAEARKYARKASDIEPRRPHAYFVLAEIEETAKSIEAAIAAWEKYIRLASGLPSEATYVHEALMRLSALSV
jgi:hypothetical protein